MGFKGHLVTDIPKFLARGERARLFPVLADTSREGRTVSILLSCLANVPAFGREMMKTVGQRVGARAQVQSFTEIVFQAAKPGAKPSTVRPDGLLLIQVHSREWRALIEAKVGTSELDNAQFEAYAETARANGIDALITISNQYTALPTHSPVTLPNGLRGKVELYHWSWMDILTKATLLLETEEIEDPTQVFIVSEMVRFLAHGSSGVKSFDQMPPAWSEVVSDVLAGGGVSPTCAEALEVVNAWHQEVRNLTLMLSRQLGLSVRPHMARALRNDHELRVRMDARKLAEAKRLEAVIEVPGAAAPMEIVADLQRRSFSVSMKLKAPEDRRSSKARLNWLLRQLAEAPADNLYVRLIGPGVVQGLKSISFHRQNVEGMPDDRNAVPVSSFEVLLVKDVGSRFGQRRNFIADIESLVPAFYEQVGQHRRVWQTAVPRIPQDKVQPSSVSLEAIRHEADLSDEVTPELLAPGLDAEETGFQQAGIDGEIQREQEGDVCPPPRSENVFIMPAHWGAGDADEPEQGGHPQPSEMA
jgi:hypothetical protein